MTEPENNNGVVISNKDIYTELLKVKEAVTAMNPQANQLQDHETRLRSVERWKYAMPASIVLALVAVVQGIMDHMH